MLQRTGTCVDRKREREARAHTHTDMGVGGHDRVSGFGDETGHSSRSSSVSSRFSAPVSSQSVPVEELLYVGNLPRGYSDSSLQRVLGTVGPVSIRKAYGHYAFVRFADPSHASAALKMDGKLSFQGQPLSSVYLLEFS